ncbi:MAG: hypothetical protein MK080_09105, partial [Opitutales bacterium]|nr:hypothetical protein [Opitutales bacterium]
LVPWRHPKLVELGCRWNPKHKPINQQKGKKQKPATETLSSNPAGIHSRAEGLTHHGKRV